MEDKKRLDKEERERVLKLTVKQLLLLESTYADASPKEEAHTRNLAINMLINQLGGTIDKDHALQTRDAMIMEMAASIINEKVRSCLDSMTTHLGDETQMEYVTSLRKQARELTKARDTIDAQHNCW